jgi:hypothetical protein
VFLSELGRAGFDAPQDPARETRIVRGLLERREVLLYGYPEGFREIGLVRRRVLPDFPRIVIGKAELTEVF